MFYNVFGIFGNGVLDGIADPLGILDNLSIGDEIKEQIRQIVNNAVELSNTKIPITDTALNSCDLCDLPTVSLHQTQ